MAADYAYMVPVLELAGFHQKFIPDILYVYNVRNPINDARVNARLQCTLAKHILGMRPYQPALHPVAVEELGEHDTAELIIFSDNPERLSRLLGQIKKLVAPIGGITVLYNEQPSYERIKNNFAGLTWLPCTTKNFKWQLLDRLETIKSNLVLLSTDAVVVDNPIVVHEGIRLLKKTHTNLFYYALGKEQRSFFAKSKLPAVDLEHKTYAWYCTNTRGDWRTPVISMTLWQKDYLQSFLDLMLFDTVQELSDGLITVLDETKMLGLLGKYSLAHDVSL